MLCLLLHPLQLSQQVKRMKVNLTFLAGIGGQIKTPNCKGSLPAMGKLQ